METCIHSGDTGLFGFKVPKGINNLKFVVKDNQNIEGVDYNFNEEFTIAVTPGYDFSRGIYAMIFYWYNTKTKEHDFAYTFYYYPDSPSDNYSDSVLYTRLTTKYKFYPYNYKDRNWKKIAKKVIPFDVYYSDEINKEPTTKTIPNNSTNDNYEVDYTVIDGNIKVDWKSIKSRNAFKIISIDKDFPGLLINIPEGINTIEICPKHFDMFKELENKHFYFKVNPKDSYTIRSIYIDIITTTSNKNYARIYMEYYTYSNLTCEYHIIELFNNYKSEKGVSNKAKYGYNIFSTIRLTNKEYKEAKDLNKDFDV